MWGGRGREGGKRGEGGEGGLYHADLKDTSSSSVTSHSLEYFECFMKVALSLRRLSCGRGRSLVQSFLISAEILMQTSFFRKDC